MTDELVPIKTFNGTVEAGLARTFLETHGIPSYVSAEDYPSLQFTTGVKLMVRAGDLGRARRLLRVGAHGRTKNTQV